MYSVIQNKADQADIINIDKSITKIKELQSQIQKSQSQGFLNQSEINTYNKNVSSLLKIADQLGVKFSNIKLTGLEDGIAEAKRAMREYQEQLNSLIKQTKDIAESKLPSSSSYKKALLETIGKDEVGRKKYEALITKEFRDQIEEAEKLRDIAKETLDIKTQDYNIAKANLTHWETMRDTKGGRTNYTGTLSDLGLKPSDIRDKGRFITKNRQTELSSIFQDVVSKSTNAEKAIENFQKKLLETETISDNVKEAIRNLYAEFDRNQAEAKAALPTARTQEKDSGKLRSDAFSKYGKAGDAVNAANKNYDAVNTYLNSTEYQNNLNAITTASANYANAQQEVNNLQAQEISIINQLASGTSVLNNDINKATSAQSSYASELNKAAVAQQSYDSQLARLSYHIKYILSIANAWRQVRSIVTQTYNDVSKLDKAFAEIAMVTNYSVSDMWGQYSNYAEMANRLGQTTESVIQASGLYYQQGLDTAEALKLTEDTMKLATLAGLDFKDATSQMTAALRAFHMEMDEGSHVTDVYAEVAANAAVDVQGLSDAMSATAAIANSSGMSFENTTAMLATMVEATQEAPKNLGTAMKSVLARFTELKKGVSDTEEDFESIDYNKVDKALKSVGISIKDANGQFRNMDEVLLELGSKWNSLSRNSQRYIATIAAGSRQQSRFIALMENYDRTVELIDVATNSAGRANEQFAKYTDTVEYKVNKIKNSWEELRVTLMNKNFFSGILDGLDSILNRMKNMDIKDFAFISTWVLTVGRTLVTGLIQAISTGGNKIRGAITQALTGIKPTIDLKQFKADSLKMQQEMQRTLQALPNENTIRAMRSSDSMIAMRKGIRTTGESLGEDQYNLAKQYNSLLYDRTKVIKDLNVKMQQGSITERDILNTEQQISTLDTQIAATEAQMTPELQQQASKYKETAITIDDIELKRIKALELEKQYADQVTRAGRAMKINAASAAIGQAAMTSISMALTGSFSATEIAASTATTSLMGMIGALSSGNPYLVAMYAAVTAISGVTAFITKQVEKQHENYRLQHDAIYRIDNQLKKLEETTEEYNKKLDEANSKYNETEEKWSNINKAAKEYQELNEKSVLTDEEEATLIENKEKLAELMPEIVAGYTAQGEVVLQTGNAFDVLIDKYKDAYEESKLLQQQAELTSNALQMQQTYLEAQRSKESLEQLKNLDVNAKQYSGSSLKDIMNNPILKYDKLDALMDVAANNPIAWLDSPDMLYRQKMYFDQLDQDASKEFKALWKDTNSGALRDLYIQAYNEVTGSSLTKYASAEDIISGVEGTKDASKTWSDMNQYVQDYFDDIDTNLEIAQKNIEKQTAEVRKNAKSYGLTASKELQTVFKQNTDFKDDDDTIANYYLDFVSNSFLTEDEINEIWDKVKDNDNAWNDFEDEINKEQKEIQDKYQKSFAELFSNKKNIELYGDYFENYQSYTGLERFQKANQLIQSIGGAEVVPEEVQNYINSTVKQSQFNIQDMYNKAIESLGTSETGKEIDKEALKKAYFSMSESAVDALNDFVAENATTAEQRSQIYQAFLNLFNEGISPEIILTAFNASDWANINLKDKQSVMDNLVTSLVGVDGLSEEQAEKLSQRFVNIFTNIFAGNLTSTDFLSTANNFVEAYETLIDKGGSLSEFLSLDVETLTLSGEQIQKLNKTFDQLKDNNLNKFLSTSGNNTILDVKGLKEYFNNLTSGAEALQSQLDNQKDLSEEEKEAIQEAIENLKKEQQVVKGLLGLEEDINTQLDKRISKISTLINAYKTLGQEIISGKPTSSSVTSFAKAIYGIDPNAKLGNYFSNGNLNYSAVSSLIDAQISQQQTKGANKEKIAELIGEKYAWIEAQQELENYKNKESDLVKAEKEVVKAHEAVQEALKNIAKAEQEIIDKQNELNKAKYGSDNFKNQLDSLYNYSTLNQKYADAMQRAKDILDNPDIGEDTKAALRDYMSGSRNQILNYLAQNRIYDAAAGADLDSLYNSLPQKLQEFNNKFGTNYDTNIKQYFKIIDGVLTTDIQALNNAALPDDIKNEIANLAQSYNSNTNNILKNNDAIKKLLKERQEIHKANLQAEVAIQEKVADVLKEKYQEQVDDLKDKYDAMKDADNDYLDALQDSIDKQRKLRDQENKYDELAQKRKKLSLQLRDTSGANALNNQKLQDEIKKDEQSLLNETIDNVLNNLKELYELQEETRQDEIEYQEALIENTNWIAEANKIVLGLGTAEDFINWMKDNSEDWKDKTAEQIELEEMELTEMFQKHQKYMEEQEQQILEGLNITEQEIQEVINNTSESLINESERSLNEITTKVDEAITSAEDSLKTAMENLAEKQKAYTEALQTESEKISDLGLMYQAASNAAQQMLDLIALLDSEAADAIQKKQIEQTLASRSQDADFKAYAEGASQAAYEASLKDPYGGTRNTTETQKSHKSGVADWKIETADEILNTSLGQYSALQLYDMGKEAALRNHGYRTETLVTALRDLGYHGYYNDSDLFLYHDVIENRKKSQYGYKAFKTGGLVNYTGPAWVDGTPTRPEAFLSADDTENIAAMTNILSSLKDLFDFSTYSQSPTINNTNKNDTTINVTVNVDGISSDYDIDQAVERVKEDIVNAASYAGANVILNI